MTDDDSEQQPGVAREAANIPLHTLVAYDPLLGDHPGNDRAVTLALSRLGEIRAVSLLRDDDPTVAPTIDVDPLIRGALGLLNQLILLVAQDREAGPEAVVGVLRERLDTLPWS